jgi:hypothetical protein
MKSITVILLSTVFGIVVGAAGTVYLTILLDGPSDKAASSSQAFQAADLDAYRRQMEEQEAIEACKEQVLGGSSI